MATVANVLNGGKRLRRGNKKSYKKKASKKTYKKKRSGKKKTLKKADYIWLIQQNGITLTRLRKEYILSFLLFRSMLTRC